MTKVKTIKFKQRTALNADGIAHYLLPLIIVVGVAIVGSYMLMKSFADTPQTRVTVATANIAAPDTNHNNLRAAAMRTVRESGARVIGWQEARGWDPRGGDPNWHQYGVNDFNSITWDSRYWHAVTNANGERQAKRISAATFNGSPYCHTAHPEPAYAMGIVLQNVTTHTKLVFINAHTIPDGWAPGSAGSDRRKCWDNQMGQVRDLAANLAPNLPTVVVGDFNRADQGGWSLGPGYDNHIAPGSPTHGHAYYDRIFTKGTSGFENPARISVGAASDHDALKGTVVLK